MRLASLSLALLLALSVACGGDNDSGASVNETEWMREVCKLIDESEAREQAFPEFAQNVQSLTLDQRKARAASLWPKQIAVHQEFVDDLRGLTPPPSARELHAAMIAFDQAIVTEVSRSLREIDQLFVSEQAVETNNARMRASDETTRRAVDAEFAAEPHLRGLYNTLDECSGPGR
jgi:hypothetical protein